MNNPCEALLLLSVGGPERPEEVRPFLDNILRETRVGIPEKRIAAVAARYAKIGGSSPANRENRKTVASLRKLLSDEGPDIPVYMGNLFSRPMLSETVRKMASDGIQNALAFVTSPFGSDFSCWRYRQALKKAADEAGASAPRIHKLRLFFNHPDFISAQVSRLKEALSGSEISGREHPLIFTAHSLPTGFPSTSEYESQIRESCRLVAEQANFPDWDLAFQSRSGPPSQSWLGPPPEKIIQEKAELGYRGVLVMPLGFMYDNLEVLYDLDIATKEISSGLGMDMIRVGTVGSHPVIIRMIRKLILEQTDEITEREHIGRMSLPDDDCLNCLCRKE